MLKDPSDTVAIKKLTDEIKKGLSPEVLDTIKIINYFQDDKTNDQVKNILDVIFNIIIAITMFLCFFSLCSSMSANLMDQTKEIGIMRAVRSFFIVSLDTFLLQHVATIMNNNSDVTLMPHDGRWR